MKGTLFYFSGTGNTKWVADRIKCEFEKSGHYIDILNIENFDGDLKRIFNYDYLIIGTPIYAEMQPKIVDDFVKKIPKTDNETKVIVYSTQGGHTSCGSESISRALSKKGYKVLIQENIKMINNYYFAVGKKPIKEDIESILDEAEQKIEKLVNSFIQGKRSINNISSLRLLLGKAASKGFKKILPKLSKNIIASKECTKCGLCVRNCPKGNITVENDRAVFHSNCMLCLRCIYICPNNLVNYKNKKIYNVVKPVINNLDIK
ncbi:(Fe-S)-binding protein [Clostridium niameyense]|uniref:(Fe-S)-binding protein n=1 Tax=Clostridium niameyense TaxID=1622073 RepID=A0A6M0RCT8_9CLOT|nr:EFR1 family ferrodoxin [Clostridium niameyense]NEZ47983.1 (Fe-S)-binding protein [Clostridium niameyense]